MTRTYFHIHGISPEEFRKLAKVADKVSFWTDCAHLYMHIGDIDFSLFTNQPMNPSEFLPKKEN